MNLKEAYKILGATSYHSLNEIKLKFKKLVKKHHPDVNKDPESEENLKKINLAYSFLEKNHKDKVNVKDFKHDFLKTLKLYDAHIILGLSFLEATLGCVKDVKITSKSICDKCLGFGKTKNNNCNKCNNSSYKTMICECVSSCDCDSGYLFVTKSYSIQIMPGTINGFVLRVAGAGDFYKDIIRDAYIQIKVFDSEYFSIENNNIVSHLDISFTESILGCSKAIKTIHGDKTIIIPANTRNEDCLVIKNEGIKSKYKSTDHIVRVKVSFLTSEEFLKVKKALE